MNKFRREKSFYKLFKKIKGKEINTLNEQFLNQEKNICFKVRFKCVDTVFSLRFCSLRPKEIINLKNSLHYPLKTFLVLTIANALYLTSEIFLKFTSQYSLLCFVIQHPHHLARITHSLRFPLHLFRGIHWCSKKNAV